MHAFNLTSVSPETHRNLDIDIHARLRGGSSDELDLKIAWDQQCRVYNEIGSLHTLEGLDKIFFVERRGGGHGEDFTPNPDRWYTPRHAYFQTNMRAPLPADLDGSADTLLILEVADDVNRLLDSIKTLTLKIALSPNDVAHSIEARITEATPWSEEQLKVLAPLGRMPTLTPEQVLATYDGMKAYDAGLPTVKDRVPDGGWICGPPDHVYEKICEIQDRFPGLARITVTAGALAIPPSAMRRDLECFGKEVLPRFKDN